MMRMQPAGELRIEFWRPDSSQVEDDLVLLGDLLHASTHAGASVGFILPFSPAEATAFWRTKVWPPVQAGVCRVLVARDRGRIVGTVQIDLATPRNQPHRAEVRKLLVHPEARRRGIARKLMEAIEAQARDAGRTLLTLDTTTGGFAQSLYSSMGYEIAGIIPDYSLQIDSPKLDPTTVMYKRLVPSK